MVLGLGLGGLDFGLGLDKNEKAYLLPTYRPTYYGSGTELDIDVP